MLNKLETRIVEEMEFIIYEIENDDKVQKIIVAWRKDWNKLSDITVYYKSGKSATFSGSLSNHKMPIKYRNYVKQILKQEGK